MFDARLPWLMRVRSRVRFISAEPLLGPLNLTGYVSLNGKCFNEAGYTDALDWVIVGGESGENHRPMQPEWVEGIRGQCEDAEVPFFFKQWGGRTAKAGGRELDGRTFDEMPVLDESAGEALALL